MTPRLLLLHGAGLGSWIWDRVLPHLKSGVRKGYCNDLDEATTELVLSRIVPEAPRLYRDRVEWTALPATMYVKLLNDKSVSVKQQEHFIERVGAARVESLNTGHLPMLAQPRELAEILNRYAGRAAAGAG